LDPIHNGIEIKIALAKIVYKKKYTKNQTQLKLQSFDDDDELSNSSLVLRSSSL
jgi:hypothetical protein